MKNKAIILTIFALAVALSLFLNKPFHVDDTLFLYSARSILNDPLQPYDFVINWSGTDNPGWHAIKNPPLVSYFIAVVIHFFGEKEIPLHAFFLLFPVITLSSLYLIAKRFVKSAIMPAIFLAISPAFFVSATSIMSDIPQLAFYLTSILVYLKANEKNKQILFFLAGSIASMAIFSKYTAASVLIVFAFFNITYGVSLRKSALAFFVPIIFLFIWGAHGIHFYGIPHFLTLSRGVTFFWEKSGAFEWFMANFSVFLIFLSGCMLFVIFFLPLIVSKIKIKTFFRFASLLLASAIISMFSSNFFRSITTKNNIFPVFLFIFFTLSAFLSVFLFYFRKRDNKDFNFLLSWIVLNSMIAITNYTIAARFLLLLSAPLAIALVYIIERSDVSMMFEKKVFAAACAALFFITISVSWSDLLLAKTHKDFPKIVKRGLFDRRVLFTGHHGFQYYMEKEGFEPLDFANAEVRKGDIIIAPSSGAAVFFGLLSEINDPYRAYIYSERGPFSIMNNGGFYGHPFGLLPYSPAPDFSEKFYLYEAPKDMRENLFLKLR